LTTRGLFTKNSCRHPKQSIPHTTLMFCGDCMKMCEDFTPNVGNKRTGCHITIMHHLTLPFSPGNFLPKTIWLSSPTHPTLLCFRNWR
jgi:hypothetical protein